MDFKISPRIEDYRARIARFVEDEIIPLEADRANYDAHENIRKDVLQDHLRAKAKARGPVVPSTEAGNRRAGAGPDGHGGVLRGNEPLDLWALRVQFGRAR